MGNASSSRGDIVVVKPNIGWDRMPIHAANTNPDVVAAVIKLAFEAGAKKVVVADGSCNDPNRCFQRSGIWRASYEMGAEVVLPQEHRFRTMRLRGDVLDKWPMFTTLVDADKVINVPVAKLFNLAKYTAAMKNWYGVLGGRRRNRPPSEHRSPRSPDFATFMRPSLVVADAWRVLLRNGPQGGNIDDAKDMSTIVATVDQVAADSFGCTLIGQKGGEHAVPGDGTAARPRDDPLGEPSGERGLSRWRAARARAPARSSGAHPLEDGEGGGRTRALDALTPPIALPPTKAQSAPCHRRCSCKAGPPVAAPVHGEG